MRTRGCAIGRVMTRVAVNGWSVAGAGIVALLAVLCAEASHLVLEYSPSFDVLCALFWLGAGMLLCFLLPDRSWRLGAVFLVVNEGHLVGHLVRDWWAGASISVGDIVSVSLAYLLLPGLVAAAKMHLDLMAERVSVGVRMLLRPLSRRRAVVLASPAAEATPRPMAAVPPDEFVPPRHVVGPWVVRGPPCVAA